MNWKLIFSLSLFGLAMAFATITLIPATVEPGCWLVVFVLCARLIARYAPGSYFWHGFLLSMVNCVWIVAAHLIFYQSYLAHHQQIVEMSARIPIFADHIRRQMVAMGPIFGAISGLIQGLFAFLASKIKRVPPSGNPAS